MTSSTFATTPTERTKKKMRGPSFPNQAFATTASRRLRSRSIQVNFHTHPAFQSGSQLVEWLREEQLQRQEMTNNTPITTTNIASNATSTTSSTSTTSTTRTNPAAKSIYNSRLARNADDQDSVFDQSRKKMCIDRHSDCDSNQYRRRITRLDIASSKYDHVECPTMLAGKAPINSANKLSGVTDIRPQRACCDQQDITTFSSIKTAPILSMHHKAGQEQEEESRNKVDMDEGIQSLLSSVEKQAQARFKAKWNFDLEIGEPDTSAIAPVCMWSVVRQ